MIVFVEQFSDVACFLFRIENFTFYLRTLLIHKKAEVPRFLDNGTTWPDLAPEEKVYYLQICFKTLIL